MGNHGAAERILQILSQTPECLLDHLVRACPNHTWNQVFLAVDRLSRGENIWLTNRGPGIYSVRLRGGNVPCSQQGQENHVVAGMREKRRGEP